jgi:hypothetical protein
VLLRTDIEQVVSGPGTRRSEQPPSEQAPLAGEPARRPQVPVAELPATAASPVKPLPHARTHADGTPESDGPQPPSAA